MLCRDGEKWISAVAAILIALYPSPEGSSNGGCDIPESGCPDPTRSHRWRTVWRRSSCREILLSDREGKPRPRNVTAARATPVWERNRSVRDSNSGTIRAPTKAFPNALPPAVEPAANRVSLQFHRSRGQCRRHRNAGGGRQIFLRTPVLPPHAPASAHLAPRRASRVQSTSHRPGLGRCCFALL